MGKNKGKKQILWERGLWVEGMQLPMSQRTIDTRNLEGKPVLSERLNVDIVLNNCADFKFEPHLLKKEIEERGHILLETVVCSPEFAGGGIEYGWGYLKFKQRERNAAATKKLESGEAFKKRVKDLFETRMLSQWSACGNFRDSKGLNSSVFKLQQRRRGDDIDSRGHRANETKSENRNVGEGASARFIVNS